MIEINLLVGFIVKPAVIVLTLMVLATLRKSMPEPGNNFFVLSMSCFLIGELFCALDVYYFHFMTLWDETLHDLGMVAAFSLFALGAYHFARNYFHCWNISCPTYRTCRIVPGKCPSSANMGPFFAWILIITAMAGLLPLFVPASLINQRMPAGFGGHIIGTYTYDRTIFLSMLQQKIFPGIGTAAIILAAVMYSRGSKLSIAVQLPLFFGFGFLSFSYIRIVLVHLFQNNVSMSNLAEELSEAQFLILFMIWFKSVRRHALSDHSPRQP